VNPSREASRLRTTLADLEVARLAAAVAAAVVVLGGEGDAFVVAALLAVAAWSVPAGLAAMLAVAATATRWGSTDLAAVTGAQEVLGAAVQVGPVAAAAGSLLAGAAVVLAARPLGWAAWRLLPIVPAGLAAAAFTGGGDLGPRLVATAAGLVAAHGVVVARSSPAADRLFDGLAVVAGVAAVAAAVLA
jgi:hypothetical protein